MARHYHQFSENEWPFQESAYKAAYTSPRVANEESPVLVVKHDAEGDWHLLDGAAISKKNELITCFGCAFEKDRTIGEVADLPLGWKAWRETAKSPWQRVEMTDVSLSQKLTQNLRSTWGRLVGKRPAEGE